MCRHSLIIFSITIGALTGACQRSAQDDNGQLKAIGGIDSNGHEKAMALLTVFNTVKHIDHATISEQFAFTDSEQMASMPFWAVVECGKRDHASALQSMSELEALSMQSKLYVNSERFIFVKTADAFSIVPNCFVAGRFLVTYPVINRVFFELQRIPEQLPDNPAVAKAAQDSLLAAQTFFLALRGPYDPRQSTAGSSMLSFLLQTAERHYASEALDSKKVAKTLHQFDADFIPCFKGKDPGVLPRWTRPITSISYSCKENDKGVNDFVPGQNGQDYVKVRFLILDAIDHFHMVENSSVDQRAVNIQFWNILTTTRDWNKVETIDPKLKDYLLNHDPAVLPKNLERGLSLLGTASKTPTISGNSGKSGSTKGSPSSASTVQAHYIVTPGNQSTQSTGAAPAPTTGSSRPVIAQNYDEIRSDLIQNIVPFPTDASGSEYYERATQLNQMFANGFAETEEFQRDRAYWDRYNNALTGNPLPEENPGAALQQNFSQWQNEFEPYKNETVPYQYARENERQGPSIAPYGEVQYEYQRQQFNQRRYWENFTAGPEAFVGFTDDGFIGRSREVGRMIQEEQEFRDQWGRSP